MVSSLRHTVFKNSGEHFDKSSSEATAINSIGLL